MKNPDIISLTKLCAPKPIATDAIPALATILVVLTPRIDNTWKNATNQLITGSGVGMLLTYRLIKNHEGKISFSSTENVGTTFQLSFPIQSEHYQYRNEGVDQNLRTVLLQDGIVAPMPEAEQTQITAHPDSPRIMIVEDNASLRLFLMKLIFPSWFLISL